MTNFPDFISALLSAFASFAWSGGVQYITAAIVFLFVIKITKELLNL